MYGRAAIRVVVFVGSYSQIEVREGEIHFTPGRKGLRQGAVFSRRGC